MAVISIGTMTDLEKTDYVREGLEFAKPNFIYQQFGMGDRVGKRQGHTRQWFRLDKVDVESGSDFQSTATYVKNTTGTPPTFTPATPTDTTVSAQADYLFGKGHSWYDGAAYTSFADIEKELRGINGQHAGEATETEVRDVLKAGTYASYGNGKASRNLLAAGDEIDLQDLLKALTNLRNRDAKPIRGNFRAMISANILEELLGYDTAFRTIVSNSSREYFFTGTVTEFLGIGFQFSSLAPTVSDSGSNNAVSTVEQTIVVGQNSYGITKWMLNDYDVVYTPPGGHGDEYRVKHSLTWKHVFKSVILNQTWLERLETTRRA